MLGTPFSGEAARYARVLARKTDRFTDPAEALAQVLGRWSTGEVLDHRERRMAARLAAERSSLQARVDAEVAATSPAAALPAAHTPVIVGDDDDDSEILDDVDDFYADALEVLE
jgi:hypothetical protein